MARWDSESLQNIIPYKCFNGKLSFCRIKNTRRISHPNHEYAVRSFYFAFFFSLFTKRQTHAATKTAVAAISTGHTGSGQTLALISFSPW